MFLCAGLFYVFIFYIATVYGKNRMMIITAQTMQSNIFVIGTRIELLGVWSLRRVVTPSWSVFTVVNQQVRASDI